MNYTKLPGLKRNNKITPFRLLLIAEAILLLYSLCLFARPMHQYVYAGEELESEYGLFFAFPGYDIGCYLDNSIDTGEEIVSADPYFEAPSLLFVSSPATDLPRGSYRVSIIYDTQGDTQSYSASSDYNTFPVLTGHEKVHLSPQYHEATFHFSSPIKVEGYQVRADYDGNGYLFVESISISETNSWKKFLLFWVVFLSVLLDVIIVGYPKMKVSYPKEVKTVLPVLFFLTVFTSAPVLSYYLPNGGDLGFHLNRIEAIKEGLLSGQFPVRVSPYWNNGYGYASSVFYGDLFLYLPALLRLAGFTVQGAYKFYLILINLVTGLLTYYCFYKIFHNYKAVLIGCIVYMLAPYRLCCLFLRGAVGEYTAMTFFPLIFYGLYRIYTDEPDSKHFKSNWIPATLGYTAIIQCHVLSSIMAGIFTLLFCLLFIKKTLQPKRLLQLCKAVGAVILLNCWFIIPFLDYFRAGYTATGINPLGRFNANGAFFSQLFSLFPQGYDWSRSVAEGLTYQHEMNYSLGGGFLIVMGCYILYRFQFGKERSEKSKIGDCSFAFALLAVFMCTIWFPWDFLQQMNGLFRFITLNIQLPWRFLSIASVLLTATTIAFVCLLQKTPNRSLHYCIISLVCAFSFLSAGYFLDDYTQNAAFFHLTEGNELDNGDVGQGEYIPDGTPVGYSWSTNVVSDDSLLISESGRENGAYIVSCSNPSDTDTYADIPFLPYKGYICTDSASGSKLDVLLNVPGKVRVIVPAYYSGTFIVKFSEPWYWRASEIISLLTLLLGAAYIAYRKKGEVHGQA